MAEGTESDSMPDLKEVESKLGMKTPESLLMWMRDAAHRQEDPGWSSDDVDHCSASVADSFCDKIRQLKLEMTCLRSADVRILRQLVAVHEGIEAVRWMMEERGSALASRSSSLTGSTSSLVTIEGLGPSMSPCRESPSPSSQLDPHDTVLGEECTEVESDRDNDLSDCAESYLDTPSRGSAEERPDSPPPASNPTPGFSMRDGRSRAWSVACPGARNGLVSVAPLRLQDSGATQDFKTSSEPVRKALVRAASSRTARRKVTNDSSNQSLTHCGLPMESTRACKDDVREEKNTPSREELLLGYDAQWRWVESQDDVTFL